MLKSIRKYIVMSENNISQKFSLIKIDETRNYFIEEIKQNKLMRKNGEFWMILSTYLF